MPRPAVNLTVHFSADEIKILRRIAATANDPRTGAKYTSLAEQFGIDRTAMVIFVSRLYPLGLAVGDTNETFRATPLLVESLHELDNAPLPNRLQQITTWFNSRWWSVPFYIILVGLPALVGYVTMLKTLLEWFGVVEGARK
jgi:hypothetical protein